MVFDLGSVLFYIAGLFLLYLCCWLFIKPLKWLFKVGLSGVFGGAGILLFNTLCGHLGWHLALNPLTALIAGIWGLPGMAFVMILGQIL